jgi:phosphoribosylformylglycinamidine synthase II
MGSRAGTGIEIDLQHVPQRETGMTPYEIMLSESQERMLLVAEKGREQAVYEVFKKWGLDAVQIGVVTPDGLLRIKNHGEVVAEIPNRALADEAPKYHRPFTKPLRPAPLDGPAVESSDLKEDLLRLLGSADLCSKRWIWEQYDHQVRTNTVAGPGHDAAVVRIKETGTSVAMSLDGNGRYCSLDPRLGTKLIVAECCRNLATVGALPIATTNNLNFGNPERPEIMAQIVESIEGLSEACRVFEVPVTGGNVSLYNETLGTPILPTPVVGIVGVLPTALPVSSTFTEQGQTVVLLGGFGNSDWQQFGGTQYAKVIERSLWGVPPALDMDYEKRVQETVRTLVRERIVSSAHDLGEGGLAVALAESSFGPAKIGAAVDLDSDLPSELALFHEGPSRILVATGDSDRVILEARKNGVEALKIGVTVGGILRISKKDSVLIEAPIGELFEPWSEYLPETFRAAVIA